MIIDNDPYPARADQCASPNNAAVCITDGQVQAEIDSRLRATAEPAGCTTSGIVFLPPGVDECITAGRVRDQRVRRAITRSSDVGHGATIYA